LIYKRLTLEELKKMSKKDLLQQLGGPNDDLIHQIIDNPYAEAIKLDKFVENDLNENNIYKLQYKNYVFPISKLLYTRFVEKFGFIDIEYVLKHLLSAFTYEIDAAIEERGELKVAGDFNYFLLTCLTITRSIDRYELLPGELGRTFVVVDDNHYHSVAYDYLNIPRYPEELKDILKKWSDFFKNEPHKNITAIIHILLNIDGVEYDLTPFDFDAYNSQFIRKKEEILNGLSKIGKVSYHEDIRI